ncbi:hypothetical protein J1N35_022236, partial [Gossypium stocksii]
NFKAIEAFALLIDNVETTYSPKTLKNFMKDASATISKTKLFLLWCMYTDHLRNQQEVPNQHQPSITIEQCLECIKAQLDTFGQQMADLITDIHD